MSFEVIWTFDSVTSFHEEMDFIFKKWNQKEVIKFESLVEENLERLAKNPTIGKFEAVFEVYYLVISKQTTLYYNFNAINKTIELYLFWNNKKNPDELLKFLSY